jgi:pimeloyl-ACP methyl ester carboxylesterase
MADEPASPGPSSSAMTSFVLLPGAGSDSWYWHRVIPLLEAAGHEALAVDLPVDDDTAGLDRYVEVAVEAIEDRLPGRQDLVIVAQSMGAFTAPLLVGRVPIAELVLVVPMIAAPGERLGDWWTNTGLAQARQEVEAAGGPPAEDWDAERMFLHDVPPDVAAASADHVTEQSDRPSADTWPLDAWPDVPIRVVVGRDDRLFPLTFQHRVVRERLGIVPDELSGGHLPALARPADLVEYLLS